jgi:hypothetical protein
VVIASARTSDFGDFELPVVDVNGILTIRARGYATKRLKWPVESESILNVQLDKGARLEIQVRTQAGALVPAVVSVGTQHPGNYVDTIVRSPSGLVVIDDAPSGPTTVVVRSKGLAPEFTKIHVEAGDNLETIDFRLRPAGSLAGMVVDSLGNPRAGAVISVAYASNIPMRAMLASAVGGKRSTNDDGTFHLSEIVPGVPVRVYVASEDQRAETVITLQAGEERTGLQLPLK